MRRFAVRCPFQPRQRAFRWVKKTVLRKKCSSSSIVWRDISFGESTPGDGLESWLVLELEPAVPWSLHHDVDHVLLRPGR